MSDNKLIVIAGPSGAGKTTLARYLIDRYQEVEFCVSATTRLPRENERSQQDYFFLSLETFLRNVQNDEFVEYEEVFKGVFYGTPKHELKRIWEKGHLPILDVDVKGALNIRKKYPEKGVFIFIHPGSEEELRKRLRNRQSESEEKLNERIARSKEELEYVSEFDYVIYNEDLDKSRKELFQIIDKFLGKATAEK